MTRDDLFNTNASIVKNLAEAAAKYAGHASLSHLAITHSLYTGPAPRRCYVSSLILSTPQYPLQRRCTKRQDATTQRRALYNLTTTALHDSHPRRMFGVTTLDVVRANTFVAEAKKLDVTKTSVPVVGGHAGTTIIPLLSRVCVPVDTYCGVVSTSKYSHRPSLKSSSLKKKLTS